MLKTKLKMNFNLWLGRKFLTEDQKVSIGSPEGLLLYTYEKVLFLYKETPVYLHLSVFSVFIY